MRNIPEKAPGCKKQNVIPFATKKELDDERDFNIVREDTLFKEFRDSIER